MAAKLRVHVKNNHASAETFPPTIEGEAVFIVVHGAVDGVRRVRDLITLPFQVCSHS